MTLRRKGPSGPVVQIGEVFTEKLPLPQGLFSGTCVLQVGPSMFITNSAGNSGTFWVNVLPPDVPEGFAIELVDAWMVVAGSDPANPTAVRSFQLFENGPIGGQGFAPSTILGLSSLVNVPVDVVGVKTLQRMSEYPLLTGEPPPYRWPDNGANWTLVFGIDSTVYNAQQYIWELGLEWRYIGAGA